jgi:hypothetical protein
MEEFSFYLKKNVDSLTLEWRWCRSFDQRSVRPFEY